jgi:hypothetical protein
MSFLCYETDNESYEILYNVVSKSHALLTKAEIPCRTDKHFLISLFQLCKYSSCSIRLQSSPYTRTFPSVERQCRDPQCSILLWIKFGIDGFEVDIIWLVVHCGWLPTCCYCLLDYLTSLRTFRLSLSLYIYIYLFIYLYIYRFRPG